MRIRVWQSFCAIALLLTVIGGVGCRSKPKEATMPRTQSRSVLPTADKPVVVPSTELSGRVARLNPNGRFVVLVFPVGQLPRVDQPLGVYRDGLRVAEVKVTGPQLDDSIVADITEGTPQEGDVVRP